MRKRFVTSTPTTVQARGERWLDLDHAATVEVTSEDKDFPIESALSIEPGQGWRASEPGVQTIRLLFDEPQVLKCVSLVFEEDEMIRTQQVVKSRFLNALKYYHPWWYIYRGDHYA